MAYHFFFIAGLHEYLKFELLLAQLESYYQVVSLAKLHEQKWEKLQQTIKTPSSRTTFNATQNSTFKGHTMSGVLLLKSIMHTNVNSQIPAVKGTNTSTFQSPTIAPMGSNTASSVLPYKKITLAEL